MMEGGRKGETNEGKENGGREGVRERGRERGGVGG